MIVATLAALAGILAVMVSLLQQVPPELRTACIWIFIVCELIFLLGFMTLTTHSD